MNNQPSREVVTAEILAHLYEKYGVEFTVIDHVRGNGFTDLHVYPVDGCPIADRVRARRITYTYSDEVWFDDNFFGILIREDVEADILSMLDEFLLEMKVFFHPSSTPFPRMFDGTKTYADLLQWMNEGNHWSFRISIVIPANSLNDTEKEEYAEQIFNKLQVSGFVGSAMIRFSSNEIFERFTRANYNEFTGTYREVVSSFPLGNINLGNNRN